MITMSGWAIALAVLHIGYSLSLVFMVIRRAHQHKPEAAVLYALALFWFLCFIGGNTPPPYLKGY